MDITRIIEAIEEIAPLSGQASWDKSGIQVTREGAEIKKIAVFLDPLPTVLQACGKDAQFLLSHHPLSLNPELPAKHNNWYYSLRQLFLENCCLYAAHTSLDIVLNGPAGWLGRALQLRNMEPLERSPAGASLGYGGIGDLPEPEILSDLIQKILKFCHCPTATLCGPKRPNKIERVAFCGGSGASLIPLAEAKGAHLYITGDVKHHAAIEASIPVLDVGHHSMEEEMMRHFAIILQNRLKDIEIVFKPSSSPFSSICAGE